jgi:hypothetical protein
MAIKSTGPVSGLGQFEDLHHINYDCTPEGFRYTWELLGTSHNGCFAGSAFGDIDIASYAIRQFSASLAIPVRAAGNQGIVPIPGSAGIATTSSAGLPKGSYLHIYTYLPSQAQLQYDWQLHPYLQLPLASNMVLSDPAGRPLPINAQTVAYSGNGSWMVVESPWHSFVRVNMATFDMVPFAPSFTTLAFDYAPHESQVAITDDGRYVAVQSNEFKSFKVYDLAACSGDITADLQPLNCKTHDYQSYVAGQVPGLTRIQHVRFNNDGLISFHALHGGAQDTYLLAPEANITNLLDYLALGDSYSSGEGAFGYASGTDTANDTCHQSVNSYPYLLAKDVFNRDGSRSVACSGAIIDDINNRSKEYVGQVKDGVLRRDRTNVDDILANFTPGYLAQYEFVQKYQPRVLTVGIGGNDIGFGDILATCVSPVKEVWPALLANPSTCYGSQEDRQELADRINGTYEGWLGLYNQLRQLSPSTRIYAIGYPQIAAVGGNCGTNVHLDADEVQFAHDLINYLNTVIRKAADDAGVTYVDIGDALDGHRLCEAAGASLAVNGLTAGTDKFHALGNESYHPNALGHELIEQAILRATRNFSEAAPAGAAAPSAPVTPPDSPLLNAPKSGRSIRSIVPGRTLSNGTVIAGSYLHITAPGVTYGLQPYASYAVRLSGSAVALGTVTTNDRGDIDGTVLVPDSTAAGSQTLTLDGTNLAGQSVTVTQEVYVAAGPGDSDGDGIIDASDSCPAVTNSGQDADQDGTDDACDGFIGAAPLNGSGDSSASTPGAGSDTAAPALNTSSGSEDTAPSTSGAALASTTASRSGASAPAITTMSTWPGPTRPSAAQDSAPTAGAVLGAKTTGSGKAPSWRNRISQARDNLSTIHWLPWGIDAGLLLVLLMSADVLFRRLSRTQ